MLKESKIKCHGVWSHPLQKWVVRTALAVGTVSVVLGILNAALSGQVSDATIGAINIAAAIVTCLPGPHMMHSHTAHLSFPSVLLGALVC